MKVNGDECKVAKCNEEKDLGVIFDVLLLIYSYTELYKQGK